MQRWEELAYAREDGIAKGEHMRLVSIICKKMKMNQTLEKIAEKVFKQMTSEFTGG